MIYAFSDGGCRGNPGPGGWGAVVKLDKTLELNGFDPSTTNNKMELTGAIVALQNTPVGSEVTLSTDSQYVIKGITEWIHGWKRKGWMTAGKDPVKNVELWKQLDAEVSKRKVSWEWVKGHAGHPENERCDELANQAMDAGLTKVAKDSLVPSNIDMSFEM